MKRIGVIGAGSWGTTLADMLAKKGHDVVLWAYEPELVTEMTAIRQNSVFLPGITLSPALRFTNHLPEAVRDRQMLLFVPPSQVVRGILAAVAPIIGPETVIVSASKGIELESLKTVSQIYEEVLPPALYLNFAALSGPSFAREVAEEKPTAVVAAAAVAGVAVQVQQAFTTPYFRVYTNSDVMGVELGGAIKNVVAIAAGITDGLCLGHNARAALITRGLAEITRLGTALGASAATFSGLAGMGDLVLTCTGDLSRNRSVGMKLGQGMRLAEIMAEMRMVAEGVKTTESAWNLAERLRIRMPITEQVYRVLYENKPAHQAVIELMTRDLKSEGE